MENDIIGDINEIIAQSEANLEKQIRALEVVTMLMSLVTIAVMNG